MDNNFNRVRLCGRAAGEPELSHINHGESFYRFPLSVERLSGQEDRLPVILPRPLLEAHPVHTGDVLTLTGQLRSFNNRSGQGPRLVISVFVRELVPGGAAPFNQIQLSGILCKTPTLRRTPLGREICDLILAVNRRYGRADYLPCIAWGSLAHLCGSLTVGDRERLTGRLQSRLYSKTIEGRLEERTAFEVSIMSLTQEEVSSPPEPVLLHTQAAHAEGGL